MPRIAIMQGRLLPPEGGRFQCFPGERWREEFPHAEDAALDAIEWIYDLYGAAGNPLATDDGVTAMRTLSERHGIAVVSLCADYFMDRPFVTADPVEFAELREHLMWLMGRCQVAGISRMVLPFVDASRIQNHEQGDRIVRLLRAVLPAAAAASVELHLETSLGPAAFAELLAAVPDHMLKANYDSGNSSSLGYDVRQELAAYGSRIGSVHIKDRVLGGSTVPLGTGDADLPALLAGLVDLNYSGDYVLQVARSVPGDEIAWAGANRDYLLNQLEHARTAVCGSPR
jgi:L-ribulose-5-phosphate 3-epimerase